MHLEIYCGKLFDLVNERKMLQAREMQKVVIVGLKEQVVYSMEAMMSVVQLGLSSRTTGVTGTQIERRFSYQPRRTERLGLN